MLLSAGDGACGGSGGGPDEGSLLSAVESLLSLSLGVENFNFLGWGAEAGGGKSPKSSPPAMAKSRRFLQPPYRDVAAGGFGEAGRGRTWVMWAFLLFLGLIKCGIRRVLVLV